MRVLSLLNELLPGLKVNFKSGRVIDTDMVILSIGVRPNNSLAVSAGIKSRGTGRNCR